MKKIVAILLILCLCPLCAWAETAENAEDVSFEKLTHAIFEANQLDALFSRYESVQFQFSDPNAPDGYDVIWETKDVYSEKTSWPRGYIIRHIVPHHPRGSSERADQTI